ncbi:unnamed protein product [Ascophyllum nodosum]
MAALLAEESLATLPQKRSATGSPTNETLWSAALIPSPQNQESSSQETAEHAACAKRRRVEGIPSSAPGPIANMTSNVPMSPEALPLTTSEREEARADPKAMTISPEAVLDVGAGNDVARGS